MVSLPGPRLSVWIARLMDNYNVVFTNEGGKLLIKFSLPGCAKVDMILLSVLWCDWTWHCVGNRSKIFNSKDKISDPSLQESGRSSRRLLPSDFRKEVEKERSLAAHTNAGFQSSKVHSQPWKVQRLAWAWANRLDKLWHGAGKFRQNQPIRVYKVGLTPLCIFAVICSIGNRSHVHGWLPNVEVYKLAYEIMKQNMMIL